jgi:hypothetical protein
VPLTYDQLDRICGRNSPEADAGAVPSFRLGCVQGTIRPVEDLVAVVAGQSLRQAGIVAIDLVKWSQAPDPQKAESPAESIVEKELGAPILVRRDSGQVCSAGVQFPISV